MTRLFASFVRAFGSSLLRRRSPKFGHPYFDMSPLCNVSYFVGTVWELSGNELSVQNVADRIPARAEIISTAIVTEESLKFEVS
jgi:hypothetical protein